MYFFSVLSYVSFLGTVTIHPSCLDGNQHYTNFPALLGYSSMWCISSFCAPYLLESMIHTKLIMLPWNFHRLPFQLICCWEMWELWSKIPREWSQFRVLDMWWDLELLSISGHQPGPGSESHPRAVLCWWGVFWCDLLIWGNLSAACSSLHCKAHDRMLQ